VAVARWTDHSGAVAVAVVEKGLIRECLAYAAKPAYEHCCKLKADE